MIGTIHLPTAYLQEFGTVHATNIRGAQIIDHYFLRNNHLKSAHKLQQTINDRLKILINALKISARAFSAQLEVPESNTRNYLDKTTKLNSDYLERIAIHFKSVNLSWLITGEGSIFNGEAPSVTTTRIKKVTGGAVNSGSGDQHVTLEACQRELESMKRDAASYQREIELLKGQLESKDALIAAKDEMLNFLRGGFNRPN